MDDGCRFPWKRMKWRIHMTYASSVRGLWWRTRTAFRTLSSRFGGSVIHRGFLGRPEVARRLKLWNLSVQCVLRNASYGWLTATRITRSMTAGRKQERRAALRPPVRYCNDPEPTARRNECQVPQKVVDSFFGDGSVSNASIASVQKVVDLSQRVVDSFFGFDDAPGGGGRRHPMGRTTSPEDIATPLKGPATPPDRSKRPADQPRTRFKRSGVLNF
jgi:hypothetical protein